MLLGDARGGMPLSSTECVLGLLWSSGVLLFLEYTKEGILISFNGMFPSTDHEKRGALLRCFSEEQVEYCSLRFHCL